MRKKSFFLIITFGLSLILLEFGFYLISFFIPTDYYYKPPTFHEFTNYLSKNIDSRLGWVRVAETHFPQGYRISPAGKNMPIPFISLYGDSFTWAEEVTPEQAWGNILTGLTGCRVDNYGVPGYGTDQAYLHFLYNKYDEAKITILCHLSENIIRNINQDRALLYGHGIMLKPRFLTDRNGNLTLVKLPKLDINNYHSFVSKPERFLTAEFLLPETSALARRRLGFPFLFRVPYIITYKRIYMNLGSIFFDSAPWYSELYDPNHPSQAFQVTRDIMLNFVKEATIRGKIPIIFFIPTIRDMIYFKKTGTWTYSSLLNCLKQKSINVYNLGPLLLNRVSSDDIYSYFSTNKFLSGHYTPKGNKILAEVVAKILVPLPSVPPPCCSTHKESGDMN
jgi:hypothetical protein